MAELQSKELDAFLAFFTTFNLHRPITAAADMSDGAGLFEILSTMCGSLPNLIIASDS
jgi:protein HOOK3